MAAGGLVVDLASQAELGFEMGYAGDEVGVGTASVVCRRRGGGRHFG